MAGDLGDLVARLKVDTSSLDKAVLKTKGLGNALSKSLLLGAGAVIGLGVLAADLSMKFQTALSAISARTGQTAKDVQAIGDAFLATSGTTTFSAIQMAQAFAPVSAQLALMQGRALGAGQATMFMRSAMDLAEASGQGLNETTAALAQVMQAYRIPVTSVAKASDLLWNTSKSLNIDLPSLVGTVDKLHAKLGPLAPSLRDVASLLLDVATHGLTGNRALLLVSTGMNTLLGGSKATDKELQALNLTIFTASGSFVGMQSVIAQLAPKLAALTEEERLHAEKALFGAGASKALDATIMAGLPGWDLAAKAADKQGTAQAGAKAATDNLKGSLDKLKAGLSDILTSFGKLLDPILKLAANDALPAINAALKIMGTPPISTILVSTLIAIVASFTTWKAIAVGGQIVAMLRFMGGGGAAGLVTFGAASTTAFAPWLLAVGPVTAIVAAILSMQGIKPGQNSIGNPFGLTVPGMPGNTNNAISSPLGNAGMRTIPIPGRGGNTIHFANYFSGNNLTPADVANAISWQLKTAAI